MATTWLLHQYMCWADRTLNRPSPLSTSSSIANNKLNHMPPKTGINYVNENTVFHQNQRMSTYIVMLCLLRRGIACVEAVFFFILFFRIAVKWEQLRCLINSCQAAAWEWFQPQLVWFQTHSALSFPLLADVFDSSSPCLLLHLKEGGSEWATSLFLKKEKKTHILPKSIFPFPTDFLGRVRVM